MWSIFINFSGMRLACLHIFFHAVRLDFNENLDGKLHTFIRSLTFYPDFLQPNTFHRLFFSLDPYLKEFILKCLFCALLQRKNWKIELKRLKREKLNLIAWKESELIIEMKQTVKADFSRIRTSQFINKFSDNFTQSRSNHKKC